MQWITRYGLIRKPPRFLRKHQYIAGMIRTLFIYGLVIVPLIPSAQAQPSLQDSTRDATNSGLLWDTHGLAEITAARVCSVIRYGYGLDFAGDTAGSAVSTMDVAGTGFLADTTTFSLMLSIDFDAVGSAGRGAGLFTVRADGLPDPGLVMGELLISGGAPMGTANTLRWRHDGPSGSFTANSASTMTTGHHEIFVIKDFDARRIQVIVDGSDHINTTWTAGFDTEEPPESKVSLASGGNSALGPTGQYNLDGAFCEGRMWKRTITLNERDFLRDREIADQQPLGDEAAIWYFDSGTGELPPSDFQGGLVPAVEGLGFESVASKFLFGLFVVMILTVVVGVLTAQLSTPLSWRTTSVSAGLMTGTFLVYAGFWPLWFVIVEAILLVGTQLLVKRSTVNRT